LPIMDWSMSLVRRTSPVESHPVFNSWAGLGAVPVTGNADEIESGIDLQLAGQVAEKDCRAFQHAEQNYLLTFIIPVDVGAHLSHTLGDLFTSKEYLQLRHGVSY